VSCPLRVGQTELIRSNDGEWTGRVIRVLGVVLDSAVKLSIPGRVRNVRASTDNISLLPPVGLPTAREMHGAAAGEKQRTIAGH
jgi:hypothetical protein